MNVRDKIKGALYGVAVGDALGAPCEFRRPSDIKMAYGRVTEMNGGGDEVFAPGEFTDDTWLTLAACRAYDDDSFNPQKAGDAMVTWMRTDGKGIGFLTNVSLAHLSSGRADIYTAGKKALKSRPGGGAGNGSLMRCVATGLVHSLDQMDDIIKESTIISEITHADPRCVAACVGYNIIIAGLLEDKSFNHRCSDASIKTNLIDKDTANIFSKHAHIFKPHGYDINDMKHMGYVLRALDRALASMNYTTNTGNDNSFEDEIVTIVNEGGDADTNAAIAGGLLGAHYGFDAIPKRWLEALADIDEIEEAVDVLIKYREKNV